VAKRLVGQMMKDIPERDLETTRATLQRIFANLDT
jgi:hypothetical protein